MRKVKIERANEFLKVLDANLIAYTLLDENCVHYRFGDFDFWPTTGKFYNRVTKEKGNGVEAFIYSISQIGLGLKCGTIGFAPELPTLEQLQNAEVMAKATAKAKDELSRTIELLIHAHIHEKPWWLPQFIYKAVIKECVEIIELKK